MAGEALRHTSKGQRAREQLKHRLPLQGRIKFEPYILLALLAICGAVWGFVLIADEVLEGDTQSFDESILLAMRNPDNLSDPIGPGWVEEMGRDFTALGGTAILGLTTGVIVAYLLLISKPRIATVLLIVTVGALVTSHTMKYFIDRPRPDLVPHGSIVYTQSFPSGHSMQAAATYLTLAALLARVQRRRRIGLFIIAVGTGVTALVGLSRVYLGVHWPTDVLAGWTIGAAWALISWLLIRWMQHHGQAEPDEHEE